MTDNIPETTNYLSPNGFRLTIEKLPNVSYFSQEAPLPEISLASVNVASPHLTQVPFSGTDIGFMPLTINFLIDENLENYKQMFNWMIGLGAPDSYSQYDDFVKSQQKYQNESRQRMEYSDGTLQILSMHNTAIAEIVFVDLTPISLSGLPMGAMNTDVEYVQATATLEYTLHYFK